MARAVMPMFSPSCGSTKITTGPSKSWPVLVLSVPDPDITSLSGSASGDIESGSGPDPAPCRRVPIRLPVRHHFSSEFIGLVTVSESRPKPRRDVVPSSACARSAFGYGINHNPSEAAKRPEGPVQRPGEMGGFHAPQMVTGDRRTVSHPGRRLDRPPHTDLRRHPDRGYPLQGRQG